MVEAMGHVKTYVKEQLSVLGLARVEIRSEHSSSPVMIVVVVIAVMNVQRVISLRHCVKDVKQSTAVAVLKL